MIQKSELELSFVEAKGPLPTVEVDLDSIPADMYGYGDLVAKALQGYLNSSPSTVATVYDYHTQSVNFRGPTSSAFLLVAGSDEILARLLYAFKKVPGIRARYSDSIPISSSTFKQFHLQDGRVWRPADSVTWYSEGDDDDIGGDGQVEVEEIPSEWPADEGDPLDSSTKGTKISVARRSRNARADAQVGSIIKAIEKTFGLPEGSVAICGPDRTRFRPDMLISTLRKRWE